MDIKDIRQGEVWFVNLGENRGSIQSGNRPCIVVSNDDINQECDIYTVVPLTTKKKKLLPVHVNIPKEEGIKEDSTALAEQLRAVIADRFIHRITKVSDETLAKVLKACFIQLGMSGNE